MKKVAKVIVVGAGPAGLAVAACLKKTGLAHLVLEKQEQAGVAWRNHYERLHLHTPKSISALPWLKFDPAVQRYPSRDEFVAYLDTYCRHFSILPVCQTEVFSAERSENTWILQTSAGIYQASVLVLATGINQRPRSLALSGLEGFPGRIVHSSEYKSGREFSSRKVLVVGFGNSGGEIAMDLHDHGAVPVMSVRSPVNVIPLNLLGIPVLHWARWLSVFPGRISDRISAPLRRLATGNLGKTGLQKAVYGPAEQVERFGNIPMIDIGTLRYLREGKIRVAPGLQSVCGNNIAFTDGSVEAFDDIVAATGYDSRWPEMPGFPEHRLADLKLPFKSQAFFGLDDLYGCGFRASGTGMLRTIGTEAVLIAEDIRRRYSKATPYER